MRFNSLVCNVSFSAMESCFVLPAHCLALDKLLAGKLRVLMMGKACHKEVLIDGSVFDRAMSSVKVFWACRILLADSALAVRRLQQMQAWMEDTVNHEWILTSVFSPRFSFESGSYLLNGPDNMHPWARSVN